MKQIPISTKVQHLWSGGFVPEELDRFTAGKELPADIAKSQGEGKPIGNLRTGGSRKVFCILDHVGKTRIVGKNHVARCHNLPTIKPAREQLCLVLKRSKLAHMGSNGTAHLWHT